jgi:hypothetical protein
MQHLLGAFPNLDQYAPFTAAVDGAYRETPTTPLRPRWRRHPRPKPPPSLPLLCPERKHSASSQALSTIGGLSGFSRLILRLRG